MLNVFVSYNIGAIIALCAWLFLFILFVSTIILTIGNFIIKVIKHYKLKKINEKTFRKYNFQSKY